MSQSARFTAMALRLINQRGATVAYTEVTPGTTYDADTGDTAVTKKTRNVKAVAVEMKETNADRGVVAGDLRLTVAGFTFNGRAPTPGDRVMWQGFEYAVVTKWPTYAEDKAVCIDILARRT